MDTFNVDIVVPVWNRPVETRNCLVSLMANSPGARFILVDNGSDRETERLMEEFAEILNERALFLKNRTNQGFVKAVNRGLARGEAEYLILMRNTSLVCGGWLEPLLECAASRPDAGVVVPRLVFPNLSGKENKGAPPSGVHEVSHGSFACMLVRKSLFDSVGGFDEEMDGAEWCLKDFSRRALRNGFLTLSVDGPAVRCTKEVPLGSAVRREEMGRRSVAVYEERWGKEMVYAVYLPGDIDLEAVRERFSVMLDGARMGHLFTVIVHPKLYRALAEAGYRRLHGNICVEPLPRLFAKGALAKAFERLGQEYAHVVTVTGIDGLAIPGVKAPVPFSSLEEEISRREAETRGVRQAWEKKCDDTVSVNPVNC